MQTTRDIGSKNLYIDIGSANRYGMEISAEKVR